MHTIKTRKKSPAISRFASGRLTGLAAAAVLLCLAAPPLNLGAAPVSGWLSWRGPEQTGVSRETGLPEQVALQNGNLLWSADFPGKAAPAIADGKVYVTGYLGEGPDLQEGVACFDAETGKPLWRSLHNDYLSDTVYYRYATSSPTIDPETGNIYIQGTQGLLAAFTPEGKLIWKKEMMEAFGRLTFPNSRTASPVIDRELVITRGITANWGAHGAGGDRFYAFDKKTGDLVWSSSPADRPKDNSFSHPIMGWLDGRRVFYAATGDGAVVCVNARTGEPIWRVPLFKAGINATVLVHNNDKIIAVFGTPYELGHTVAFKIPHDVPAPGADGPVIIDRAKVELWTCDISSSTSSPILVGDRVYLVAEKGDLCSVDALTGKLQWKLKLGIEQRNSCPMFAGGLIYVPVLEDPDSKTGAESDAGTKGVFYIVQPGDAEGKVLSKVQLEGRCFGTPAAYNGKVYLQTASKLYCFGKAGNSTGLAPSLADEKWPAPGPATQLQIVPSEVLLKPGEAAGFRVRSLDAKGFVVEENINPAEVHWDSFIPPTARVKSKMKATFQPDGKLVADAAPVTSAGAFVADYKGLKGYFRGRVLPALPIHEDFTEFTLDQTTTNAFEPPTPFAYPPLAWIGARIKFEVRELDGVKVLAKTIDNKFFQRAFVFIGEPDSSNYTVSAEVMSDGNRRKMSDVGVINQRYLIVLRGNEQKLEISSNQELFRFSTPFTWSPKNWYTLKARVDRAADGSAVIRGKAWKTGEPEPQAWTFEVPHHLANANGSPGLYGFSPQDMRVYVKKIEVNANE